MDVEDMRKDLTNAVNLLPARTYVSFRQFASENWETLKAWIPVAAALLSRHFQAALMTWPIMSDAEKKELETMMKEVLAPKLGGPPGTSGHTLSVGTLPACMLCQKVGHLAANCPDDPDDGEGES